MENSRRSFLKKVSTAGLGVAGLAATNSVAASTMEALSGAKSNKSRKGGKNDGKLRFGFIGTGLRCQEHIKNVLSIPDNIIVAICDTQDVFIQKSLKLISNFNVAKPKVYTSNERAYEQMLNNEDLDCVIIASPWEWHTPMAIAAMKAGIPYVGVEVAAAVTLEECWDLVNVAEATGCQLNMLENVCYREDCLAVLNMVRQGLFGELLHARCGYEHDLRNVKFNDGKNHRFQKGGELRMGPTAYAEAQWRGLHSVKRNGDLYPTHGVGPVATYLDINYGNRFLSLTAMSTQSRGLHKFVVDNGGPNHPYSNIHFNLGDIVTSMIKCSNGQTVIVTHDTSSPRPYSLGFRVQGTEGLWMNDGNTVYIDGKSDPHRWDDSKKWFDKYPHKFWTKLKEKVQGTGHGGMDYVMMADFVDVIRNKKPAPMDCYDAAAWSAVSALSEMSIARGGDVVDFPDFTRGQWIHRQPRFAL